MPARRRQAARTRQALRLRKGLYDGDKDSVLTPFRYKAPRTVVARSAAQAQSPANTRV
jgi:hypothetical protein